MDEDNSPTRVERDRHGVRTAFEDIEVGADLGELEWEVTEEMIDRQCALDLDFDPLFFLDTDGAGRMAPPQITYRPPRWLLSRRYNIRGVLYKWSFDSLSPIRAGERVTVRGRVADKYVKGEREFLAFEAWGENAGGELLFRTTRVHAVDVIPRSTPRSGEGVDSGRKAEKI